MKTRTLVLAPLAFAVAAPAFAEQSLPSDQQKQVETKLKDAGYGHWDEIGMADGVIKVDNAVGSDGKTYDLEPDPKSMDVTNKKPE